MLALFVLLLLLLCMHDDHHKLIRDCNKVYTVAWTCIFACLLFMLLPAV